MTTDPIESLLESSRPTAYRADRAALDAMVSEARAMARPKKRRRARFAIGASLAAVLIGGAGAAVATDGLNWGAWLQDPVSSYEISLPNGLACEVRVAQYDWPGHPLKEAEINRIVRSWWNGDTAGIVAQAEALVSEMIQRQRETPNTAYDADTGTSEPGGYGTTHYDEDWEYYWAWSMAVAELEDNELVRHGYDSNNGGLAGVEGGEAIKCLDANGDEAVNW